LSGEEGEEEEHCSTNTIGVFGVFVYKFDKMKRKNSEK